MEIDNEITTNVISQYNGATLTSRW